MEAPVAHTHMISLDLAALRTWPLPMPSPDGDKEQRGHVLVLGGSREMPGAVILAATAAMRAGAGKLTIATGASVAQLVALAIPEARVIGLPETPQGGFAPEAQQALAPLAGKLGALLVGPGMQDEAATSDLVLALLACFADVPVVLDACAMGVLRREGPPQRMTQAVAITPHHGEMAHLTGIDSATIGADPACHAAAWAKDWNVVLALKAARTIIAAPDGAMWQHDGGNVGLASSGSGDVLAGIVAGLAARGARLEQAVCWGVALHALAGGRLAQRIGPLGFLARELQDEIPSLLAEVAQG